MLFNWILAFGHCYHYYHYYYGSFSSESVHILKVAKHFQ